MKSYEVPVDCRPRAKSTCGLLTEKKSTMTRIYKSSIFKLLKLFVAVAITLIKMDSSMASDVIKFDTVTRLESLKSTELVFKQQDADTRQIRLVLETHFDWAGLGGYTWGLEVTINGHKVPGARLLNKPLAFKTRNGGGSKWATAEDNDYVVMYSNDFSDQIKTLESYIYGLYEEEQEPYRFVFDLTGLTQHVGENTVVIRASSKPLILRNVKIEFDDNSMPRINDPKSVVLPAPTGELADFRLSPELKLKPEVYVSTNGGISVKSGGQYLSLRSRFSLPNGKFLEIEASSDNEKATLPLEISWITPEYKIIRTIEEKGGHINVSDTFLNLHESLGGVIFDNALILPEKPDKVFFAGKEVMVTEMRSITNPTIGAQLGEHFVALLIEDDILRNQAYFSRGEKSILLGDRNLALPVNTPQTVSWSIYSIPNGGYYDFINEVRRDWESNFTCNGPFSFPYGNGCDNAPFTPWEETPLPKSTIDEFLTANPIKYIITHVPADYLGKDWRNAPRLGHGTALQAYTWWCDMTRNMTAGFKQYAPQVDVFCYLHKNLCAEQNNREKYADSVAMDYVSKHLSEGEVTARYVPTVENSYGKQLAETYRYIVENLGMNVYMDEICLGVTEWAEYPQWDNCTVTIDPQTHNVIKKLSIPNLLTKPWLEEMIAYLNSKGAILIANGPPATRTLQKHHLMHFVEQAMGASGLLDSHLSSPIAFCYESGEKNFAYLREALECGAVVFKYGGDWSLKMFPLTPLELRPGYIIAKERIITKMSGRFGWNERCNADVFVYDGKGSLTDKADVKVVEENKKTRVEIRMPSDHIAIIVRK